MVKLVSNYSGVTNRITWKFGCAAGFLSALIFAAVSMANAAYISPDAYSQAFNEVLSGMKSMMDSNSVSMAENVMNRLPEMLFITNLGYCFLWGLVLSGIFSQNIPSRDPFASNDEDHTDNSQNF
jgi:hypothetical protein